MPGNSPLQHFDYPMLDAECMCDVCVDWRSKHQAYQALLERVVEHHRSCMCSKCREMRRIRTSYHAAMNRRDLYSEMSWLVHEKSRGGQIMDWLTSELNRPDLGDGWWEGRAPYYPLAHWLSRFQTALTMLVSGGAASGSIPVSGAPAASGVAA